MHPQEDWRSQSLTGAWHENREKQRGINPIRRTKIEWSQVCCSLKTNFDSLKPPLDIEIQHFDWGKEASLFIQTITFLAQKSHDAGQVKGKLIDGCLQGLGC
jgi:hypothetical protein